MNGTSDKIKILYIITKSNWGGAQKYVYEISRALPRNQYASAVIYGDSGDGKKNEGLLALKLKTEGISETFFIKNFSRDIFFISDFLTFIEIIKTIKNYRPDIIHLNSSKAGILGAMAGKITGVKKIIFTVHGWPFNEKRDLISRLILWKISWLTVLFSNYIITVSSGNYNQCLKMPFVRKRKVHLIYNGIAEISQTKKNEARKKISYKEYTDDKEIWIGAIGELHPNKNLAVLIKAFRELGFEAKLFIVGQGQEKEPLMRLVDKLDLKNKVFLAGFIENASKYILAFDFLVLPSLKEGLPFVILEAGINKIPVIGSNIPGINDILDDESGILFESNNISSLKRALRNMAENENIRRNYSEKLYKKIVVKFNLANTIANTLALYKD